VRNARGLVVLGMLAGAAAQGQTVLYVNGSLASGSDNGQSWADAFRGGDALQQALDAAAALVAGGQTVQLWVASGSYSPTLQSQQGLSGSETFQLLSGVEVYGGFTGTESSLGQRDFHADVTTLSGVIAPGSSHAWHVVTTSGVDATCSLDGFTVSGGYANGPTPADRQGGGILNVGGSPAIHNCTITGNTAGGFAYPNDANGGGAACVSGGSPQFSGCSFHGNAAYRGCGIYGNATVTGCTFTEANGVNIFSGAAIYGTCTLDSCLFDSCYADGSGAILGTFTATSCTFHNNNADSGSGAAYLVGASTFIGCTFDHNHASNGLQVLGTSTSSGPLSFVGCRFTSNGGGIGATLALPSGSSMVNCLLVGNSKYIDVSVNASLINCTFLNNQGGSVFSLSSSGALTIANTIMWSTGNSGTQIQNNGQVVALNYSCIKGQAGAFEGVGNFSFDPRLAADGSLLAGSPCIDAGDSNAVPPTVTADVAGQPRFVDDAGMPNSGVGSPPVDIGAFEFQGTSCYANCDGSSSVPVLNVQDFTCYLQAFATGNPYANCDGSTGSPRLNVQDFTCFLQKFAVACQ
jgi:hypothetical protein